MSMSYCPISLEPIAEGERFSRVGLRALHPGLTDLQSLELSQEDQLREAQRRADKMSVQGVQPKLSAVLSVKHQRFDIVDRGGNWLLKPNPPPFEAVPANEALTMTMAAAAGIEVPMHGLLPAVDGSWVYFIRRFDRPGRDRKRHVEDFAQLSGASRDTKYDSSLEQIATLVERFCTFPALEKPKLARRLLFAFLTGNEDMHLKNFSLQVEGGVVSLTPAYDLLNTTLVLENAVEETALPVGGKKSRLTRKVWLDYFCRERLGLATALLEEILSDLHHAIPRWLELIQRSQLPVKKQEQYWALVNERATRLLSDTR
jgi:serine/threonine-protein kinase HipA